MTIVSNIYRRTILIATLLLATSLLYNSFSLTFSVFLGFFVTILSFFFSIATISSLSENKRSIFIFLPIFCGKLLLLAAILWVIIVKFGAQPIPLLIGLSSIIVAILWAGLTEK